MRKVSVVLWVAAGLVFPVLPKLRGHQQDLSTVRIISFSEGYSLNAAKDSHDMR
jgi:hypothetical protein